MKELHKRILTGSLLSLLVIVTLLFCPSWVFAPLLGYFYLLILITEWPYLISVYKDPYLLGTHPPVPHFAFCAYYYDAAHGL